MTVPREVQEAIDRAYPPEDRLPMADMYPGNPLARLLATVERGNW